MSDVRRTRILFVAEGVTLAHVTRPLLLARALDTDLFEPHFACSPNWTRSLTNLPAQFWPIESIGSSEFLTALSKGRPLYSRRTLHSYVKADLQLLETIRPDLVVGDFRLSLSVSTVLCGVPYATITNAYWSEYYHPIRYPIPELPITRILGAPLPEAAFQHIYRWIFAYHMRPLNSVRKHYGMQPFAHLSQTYTNADHVLYADIPGLFPGMNLPKTHHYLGPLSWAPEKDMPDGWSSQTTDKPLVYVNLGSSGAIDVLSTVLEALAPLPIYIVAATAGRCQPAVRSANMWITDFLPGDRIAKQATVILCNGGSPSVYQALQEGTPVIGIPSNMDQHLMMQAIVRKGAGLLIRSEYVRRSTVQEAILEILKNDAYRRKALRLQEEIAQYSATKNFAALVSKLAKHRPQESRDAVQ